MASALEAVLALKQQEAARQEFQSQQLTQAMTLFQQARQNAQEMQLKRLTLDQAQKQNEFDNTIKTAQQNSMAEYLKLLGGQGQAPTANNTITPEASSVPTLEDAFPKPEQKFIQTPYMSPQGKVGVSNKLDPEYGKQLELRNSQIKDLQAFSEPLENVAVKVQQLRDAIKATPDFKEGVGSKQIANAKLFWADQSNAKWYKDYELAYNQGILPLAQAMNASKVLSDADLENLKASLGNKNTPKDIKNKALESFMEALSNKTESTLNAYGVDKEKYYKIYPNTAKEFGVGKATATTDKKSRLEELRKKRAEGTLGK